MKMAISSVDLQTAIGRRIAKLRKDRGMGQLELCGELDVSAKHLSECERGVSMFSLERLLDICEIFDVSLDFLVRGMPTDDAQLNFPPSMVKIFESGDQEEIDLLNDYLNMYARLRGTQRTSIKKQK
ncbi:MAG: helix-turn-helix domain-containing protein [Lachnospiraceae bacterium]|nr:helix-turn-helix domain-containing protein [Lachnospiraceae bacterium]MDD7178820.1 helix-turn-helix transcriptional regulator [bacterium]MDY5516221.1 helix-turn-helix transcriptional regulator [Lachnospiraceae bacterium]